MIPTPNEGTRPSRLELGRLAAGELSDDDRGSLEARIGDAERAFLAEVEAARSALPPLSIGELRARAGRQESVVVAAAPVPAPANGARWFVALGVLAAAALAFFALPGPDRPVGDVRVRSGDYVELVVGKGGHTTSYAGEPLGEGSAVGVRVGGIGHRGVVVFSVDGRGQVSQFWPADGERPEPLSGALLEVLPGSVVLDDAPGSELFVAVFDRPVSEARALVERAYAEGGQEAVQRMIDAEPGVGGVEVARP